MQALFLSFFRFHKLIWGNFGNGSPESSGVIIGGGENGVLTMYSVHRILASKSEPVIGQTEKHSGPVRALDLNPFQVCNIKILITKLKLTSILKKYVFPLCIEIYKLKEQFLTWKRPGSCDTRLLWDSDLSSVHSFASEFPCDFDQVSYFSVKTCLVILLRVRPLPIWNQNFFYLFSWRLIQWGSHHTWRDCNISE